MCHALAMAVCKSEKKLPRTPAQLAIEILLGGRGDLVSRLVSPIIHIVNLVIPIIHLLTKSL